MLFALVKSKRYTLLIRFTVFIATVNPLTTNVPPSYRNQSVDLDCKSIDWFLYDVEHCALMG